ncbi:MAG: N-acetylneuraminate synthase [Treponema sp.]|nr:N-acetylneuraminate synthase [Treponema sp.]
MTKAKCLIIAEAGVNHNGKLDIALKLCDAAKEAGADVVKFQTWKTEKIITRTVAQAEYQTENTGKTESQFDMLKRLELSYDDFRKIKEYCDKIGIQFASTADEEESLDFLISLGIPFIKIGSGEITNIPYLRIMGSKKLPVIISSGMSTLAEVDTALNELKNVGATDITLLHCTTNYPCPMEDVNLNAMITMKNAFKLPVGYSDHTKGIEVPIAAVAIGAKVIEKHFTLDRNMKGPDHLASTEPDEFKKMVESIRNIEKAMGNGEKLPTKSEIDISKVVLKRIVASKEIKAGEVLSEENICVKRNDKGVPARYWDLIIGTVAKKDYSIDEAVEI